MLRITIELLPGGQENLAVVIGRGSIANVGGDGELYEYVCSFEEGAWKGQVRGPYRATLTAWPRTQRGAWEIVHAALNEAFANVKKQSRGKKTERLAQRRLHGPRTR
jgi:hypothetical protein